MKKTPIAIALLTCAAGPAGVQMALAQSAPAPNAQANSCTANNYDASRGMFAITNPGAGPGTVNQQCFITVAAGQPDPASGQLPAGTYEILLSGGGGGGGAGSARDGAGGGGAGAVPQRITRTLAPGTYRITIGRGGLGGKGCQTAANGGDGRDGAPSGIAEAYTGQLVAGFQGAENWTGLQPYAVASSRATPSQGGAASTLPAGSGGPAMIGQSGGGGGGRAAASTDHRAESGTWLQDVAYEGKPGSGGYGVAVSDGVPLLGGGGGGAGYGNGGDGQSVGSHESLAKAGQLGGGGGGGGGGRGVCGDGAAGGDGFVKMTLLQPAS